MYSLRRVTRPGDIAQFLSKAEKSCGYILPNSYIEKSEVYALVCRWSIIGGFVYNNSNHIFTPDGKKWEAEISHVWMSDTQCVERSTSALKQGIATVVKEQGVVRTEFLFRHGCEMESVTDIYHYEDQRYKPNPLTRSWQGFTTRWVRGNSEKIPSTELLIVKNQMCVDDIFKMLIMVSGIFLIVSAGSMDAQSMNAIAMFSHTVVLQVAADLSRLSLATLTGLVGMIVLVAAASWFQTHRRYSALIKNTISANQQSQAEAATLLDTPGGIPALDSPGS